MSAIRLGVNIDHVATLRQARGTTYPSPLEAALLCADAGADGITIHLREDRRHIQDADVFALRNDQSLPLNLEMANYSEIVDIAQRVLPDEICLVPERREELTTEGGLDVIEYKDELKKTVDLFHQKGIPVSPFIDPVRKQIETCAELETPFIELHTGTFCNAPSPALLEKLIESAEYAHGLGIKVNAGHGINMETIHDILKIPHLHTLNIGHSLIARAVMIGLRAAVEEMREAMSA